MFKIQRFIFHEIRIKLIYSFFGCKNDNFWNLKWMYFYVYATDWAGCRTIFNNKILSAIADNRYGMRIEIIFVFQIFNIITFICINVGYKYLCHEFSNAWLVRVVQPFWKSYCNLDGKLWISTRGLWIPLYPGEVSIDYFILH